MAESKSTKWRKENPEKWKTQQKAYYKKRNEKRREAYAQLSEEEKELLNKERKERRDNDPNNKRRAREYQRLHTLRQCGMSLKEAREWYRNKVKVCEICSTTEVLGIDHNHNTNKVRGFLCRACNLGIGHLKDDSTLVKNALIYLQKYDKPQMKVLQELQE